MSIETSSSGWRGRLAPTACLCWIPRTCHLAEAPWDERALLARENSVLVRSMTKDHALAGARLGYLVAGAPTVVALRRLQPSWSVSAVAQAAGLAALDDDAHLKVARTVVAQAKMYLRAQLSAIGYPCGGFGRRISCSCARVMRPNCGLNCFARESPCATAHHLAFPHTSVWPRDGPTSVSG